MSRLLTLSVSTGLLIVFPVLCLPAQAGKLAFHATAGTTSHYLVSVSETDYQGAGTEKISSHSDTATPIVIQTTSFSASGGALQVTSGPLEVKGRSVGRSKTHTFNVDLTGTDRGQPVAFFSVPLPVAGVKVGQTWRSRIYGPAPIPGGLVANYRFQKVEGGLAQIGFKLVQDGASHVEGSGTLYLRTSDGGLDHGVATFALSYRRPDLSQAGKFNIDSHVLLKNIISKQ